MSKITKYFQVTSQILIAYSYEKENTAVMPENVNALLYQGNDRSLYYIDSTITSRDSVSSSDTTLYNDIFLTKFSNTSKSEQYYFGFYSKPTDANLDVNSKASMTRNRLARLVNSHALRGILQKPNGDTQPLDTVNEIDLNSVEKYLWNAPMAYDNIRIYFLTGYVMSNCEGLTLKVKASTNRTKVSSTGKQTEITNNLADIVIFRDRLFKLSKWATSPMYMNSKFYDRYIDIKVPSFWWLSNNRNTPYGKVLNLSPSSVLRFEFSLIETGTTITPDSSTMNIKNGQRQIVTSESSLYDECTFPLATNIVEANLKTDSNSDLFNVRLYEDEANNQVIFYPVYGSNSSGVVDLSLIVMNNIETGSIQMTDSAIRDANQTADEFYEAYGEDARKWIIINELEARYFYTENILTSGEEITATSTESITTYIDYTNKSASDGAFWRTSWRPNVATYYNKKCDKIVVSVNCHLYNRYTGADIIRSASITIDDAQSKYSNSALKFDLSGLHTWKIVNKTTKNDVTVQSKAVEHTTSYTREYFDSTNLLLQANGSNYVQSQGKAILYLYHESHNYVLRLYDVNSSGARIPYNISGKYKYWLTFPTVNGTKIKIAPSVSSQSTDLGIGSILFYITEAQVKAIMAVDDPDRYFAIICDSGDNSTTTTLYEGKVQYYS